MEYQCKACRGVLNIGTPIVLSAQKINSSLRGLVHLNTELGNYTKTTHPSFKIEEGEEYMYTCPICHSQLNSAKYPHLVHLVMIDEARKEYNIYFSGIAGEKCTYKIRGRKVEMVRGPDADRYNKYFEVPDEDKKYL